jgi:microsomal epoxide hydrolase
LREYGAQTLHYQIADDILADLRVRLARVRWPDNIPGAGWQYGTDLAYIKQLVDYWRDHYDWRRMRRA